MLLENNQLWDGNINSVLCHFDCFPITALLFIHYKLITCIYTHAHIHPEEYLEIILKVQTVIVLFFVVLG